MTSNTVSPYLSTWAKQLTSGILGMGQNFYDASAAQSIAAANQLTMDYAKALTSQDRKWKMIGNFASNLFNTVGNIASSAIAAKASSAENGGKINYIKLFLR